MADTVTRTTNKSWFSRLGDSFKGILFGLILFLGAFPLLFWNEGEAVKIQKSLEEGSKEVITVEHERVDADNEGKLIHVSGPLATDDILTDDQFGIEVNAVKLKRKVEMYQWKESSSSSTKQKIGGGEETVTTYSYSKTWSDSIINSSSFEEPAGHENPGQKAYESAELVATNVSLGEFQLTSRLIERLSNYENYAVKDESATSTTSDTPVSTETTETANSDFDYYGDYTSTTPDQPAQPAQEQTVVTTSEPYQAKVFGGGYYIGANPSSPAIGDLKITYQIVRPSTATIVAKQRGSSFESYRTSNGKSIELLSVGDYSADEMFSQAEASNRLRTWIFRLLGFAAMYIGLGMILKPLSTLGAVIPLLGNIIGFATGLVSFLIALICSLVTIAIAWIFYRPILAILLLVIAAVCFYALLQIKKKKGAAVPSAEPPAQPAPTA